MAGTRTTVIWFEIWVRDLDRAKAFYTALFGWRYEALAGYDADRYWEIVPGESAGVNGALVHDPARPAAAAGRSTLVYVHVDDLDAAVERAVAAGGTLVQGRKKITETAGSFALVADPEGNELGLWVP
jgi:predicted enzyme related to lactoylglutathione lyase